MSSERFTFVAAAHVFFVRDGRILLLRRLQTGYADGLFSVPAGHLDGNEEISVAAAREAREEVGVEVAPADLAVVGVMHRRANDERVDFFLTAVRWRGEIVNAEPHKCSELAWFPLGALPDDIVPYVRRAIDNYLRGVWFDSYGWPLRAPVEVEEEPIVPRS